MTGFATVSARWDNDTCEAALGFILQDPIFNQEFLYPDCDPRKTGTPYADHNHWEDVDGSFKLFYGQFPFVLTNIAHLACGRGVGKTEISEIKDSIRRAMSFDQYALGFTALSRDYIEGKLWTEFLKILENHPILKHFVDWENTLKGNFIVTLKNGSTIQLQYVGAVKATSQRATRVQGIRSKALYFDEAQQLSIEHITETLQQQQIDPMDPAFQDSLGVAFKMYGVPDGRRDTPMFLYDTEARGMFVRKKVINGKEIQIDGRWKLPSTAMPWITWSQHENWCVNHGCDKATGFYSDSYLRNVWGLHGRESETMFPWRLREPVSQVEIPDFVHRAIPITVYEDHTVRNAAGKWESTDLGFMTQFLPRRMHSTYAFGIDVATSGTTSIIGLYNEDKKWYVCFMIDLQGWRNTYDQCVVVDYLYQRYHPIFIGIDKASDGHGIFDTLLASNDFPTDYSGVIYGFTAHEKPTVGYELDHKAMRNATSVAEMELLSTRKIPVKVEVKPWTMEEIAQRMIDRSLILPTPRQSPELHRELDSITKITFTNRTGVHNKYLPEHPDRVSALQMFVMADHLWGMSHAGESEETFDYADDMADMFSTQSGFRFW